MQPPLLKEYTAVAGTAEPKDPPRGGLASLCPTTMPIHSDLAQGLRTGTCVRRPSSSRCDLVAAVPST